jgi:nitrogen regulatory protein PII
MHSLVVLVLGKTEMLQDILRAWQDVGAAEATVLESTGLGRVSHLLGRDDVPLFPSLRALSEDREFIHNTIFSVVDSDAMVDRLIAATERVTGDLSQPNRGILFVMPVARVVGYRPNEQGR